MGKLIFALEASAREAPMPRTNSIDMIVASDLLVKAIAEVL